MKVALLCSEISFVVTLPASGEEQIKLEEIVTIDGVSAGIRFIDPADMAYDQRKDEILVADAGAGRVFIFNRRGELSGVLGRFGELRLPDAVAVDRRGAIYVAEKGSQIIKLFRGEKERVGDAPGNLNLTCKMRGEVVSPNRMVVGSDGDLWVIDWSKGYMFVFDCTGSLRYRLGVRGRDGKRFRSLKDIAVDTRGLAYTASRGLDPLRAFDLDGNALYCVGQDSEFRPGTSDPTCIAVDSRDRLWVLDGMERCFNIYSPTGLLLETITEDRVQGGLFLPIDIEIDEFGDILVLEQGANRVRVFSQVH